MPLVFGVKMIMARALRRRVVAVTVTVVVVTNILNP